MADGRAKAHAGGVVHREDGAKPVQLTNFKTDQIFWFNFSRDGKQLVLSRGTQTSDVVLIRDFR